MYLHEEYIKRHKLNIPVVLRLRRTSIFLKTKQQPYKWHLLCFNWQEPERHPGFWSMSNYEIFHNGYQNRNFFKLLNTTIDACHSNDYEKAVFGFVEKYKKDNFLAVEYREQHLAAWQMFLIMWDKWLAQNMNSNFFKYASLSLDENESLQNRIKNYESAHYELLSFDRSIVDILNCKLIPYVNKESEWLVKLIND